MPRPSTLGRLAARLADPEADLNNPAALDPAATASHSLAVAPALPAARRWANPGITLAETVPGYAAVVAERWPNRGRWSRFIGPLRLFMGVVGNKPLHAIGESDTDAFLQVLRHYPARAAQLRSYRLLSVAEAVDKARRLGDPPLSPEARQSYVQGLRAYFRWATQQHGLRPDLLAHACVLDRSIAKPPRSRPFTEAELATVLSAEHVADFRTPYHYWLPLLALYHGLRLGEAAQLYVADIYLDGETPLLEVCDDRDGQVLRHPLARRWIHIHPQLMALGFDTFVNQCKRWGRVTLFPDTSWAECGPGNQPGAWFRRLCRRCELNRQVSFDSLRLTFAERAGHARISKGRLTRWLGHPATRETTLERFYLPPGKAALSREQLIHIPLPVLDRPRYDPDQFEAAFGLAHRRERKVPPFGAPQWRRA
jgi:integrase